MYISSRILIGNHILNADILLRMGWLTSASILLKYNMKIMSLSNNCSGSSFLFGYLMLIEFETKFQNWILSVRIKYVKSLLIYWSSYCRDLIVNLMCKTFKCPNSKLTSTLFN